MNYLKVYNALIEKRKLVPPKEYFERHHIKPKSLFPELAKDKSNLVKLTYREHYLAHHLLYRYYKSIGDKNASFKMGNAWMLMCKNGDGLHVSINDFEKAKKYCNEEKRNFHHSEETKLKISLHNPNKNGLSKSHREKIGKSNKGKIHSIEQNLNHSKLMKDYFLTHNVWNKGKKTCEEVKRKMSEAMKGRICVNNGEKNKFVFPNQIPEGYIIGKI